MKAVTPEKSAPSGNLSLFRIAYRQLRSKACRTGKQSYKAACHFRLLLILYGKYRFTGEKVVPAARHYLRRANQGYVMCQVSIATSGYYRR